MLLCCCVVMLCCVVLLQSGFGAKLFQSNVESRVNLDTDEVLLQPKWSQVQIWKLMKALVDQAEKKEPGCNASTVS